MPKMSGKSSHKSNPSGEVTRTVEMVEKEEIETPEHIIKDVCFDWQEETIKAVYFSTGLLITKDSDTTVGLCQDALESMGLSVEKALEITHMKLTKREEKRYKLLFQTIVCRIHDERYVSAHILI